jgi:nucleoside-diphosphate-sugar epimerase
VIGAGIARRLVDEGHDVTIVTHSRLACGSPGHRYGDLLDPGTLPAALAGMEVVVQSVNFPTYPFEKKRQNQTFMTYDGIGTEHLVAAAEKAGVRRYVFIAGAGCRSGGDRPYWQALRRGEAAVLDSVVDGICVEPTLVFGPDDRGLNRILSFARRAHVIPMLGRGNELHQPIFVDDLARLVAQTIDDSAPTGAFAVGGPERLTMKQLIRRALAIAGLRAAFVQVPPRLARFGAQILERLPGEVLSREGIEFAMEDFVADLSPVMSRFRLDLTPIDDGLRSYMRST